MALHEANFVAIRTLHPRVSWYAKDRYVVEDPSSATELDYRDLLSAANEAYFHREYSIALKLYLQLRQKILVQSHPELPPTPSILDDLVIDVDLIEFDRIVELSRRILVKTSPGRPLTVAADERRLFTEREVTPNQHLVKLSQLTVDPGLEPAGKIDTLRHDARRLITEGDVRSATRLYSQQVKRAEAAGELRLAADTLAESGAAIATYATDDAATVRKQAGALFQRAAEAYHTLGDTDAAAAMATNLRQLEARQPTPINRLEGPVRLPVPVTDRVFLVPDRGTTTSAAALVSASAPVAEEVRSVGIRRPGSDDTAVLSLKSGGWKSEVATTLFDARVTATSVAALRGWDIVATTFVAYIPHLFFAVLPIAIADCYKAMGQYSRALDNYASVLKYPYLNPAIEGTDLWVRMADSQLRWGDELFRRGQSTTARSHYQQLITLPYAIPTTGPLYARAAFATVRTDALEVAKRLRGEPAAGANPRVAALITGAAKQLTKIAGGLNILGLSGDYAPVLRFTYLQSAANYLADNAIQAERTFIQFRTQAEQAKFERLQLENAVALNEAALAVERKREEDAALEVQAAEETLALTEVRRDNAQANLDDWNTIGRDLASVNAALAWASNAANDQDIRVRGVRYRGETHDYSGDVEDYYEIVGQVREQLNFELQQNRLERQIAESDAEVAIAETRAKQAQVRAEVQALNTALAEVRLAGAQEILEYADDRMFDEDLWFRLAGELRDLARDYLDMAIEAAYIMERAYELEFDRDLHRIRLDYGSSGPEGVLGGDHLKRDIASFTLDYIRHAEKQNPIRVPVSLREEFPQAFASFQQTGTLDFRTDLELFDRRFPGSYRRKLKRIEVFVEGLVPTNGVGGTLKHAGVSTEWRAGGPAGFFKHSRVVPAETMLLSSYQFRRDYAVLTPKEEVLTLFENLGPQANWQLTVWPSANDLDFASISDISVVFYLDGDYDPALAAHTRTLYGTTGGRSFIQAARLHQPDEYFRVERDRELTFHVSRHQLPQWVTDPELTAFAVRLIAADGAPSLANRQLTITRGSDQSVVTGTTNATGVLAGAATTMAPFDDWLDDNPADDYTIAFADGDDLTAVVDVHLAASYRFTYRSDPVA